MTLTMHVFPVLLIEEMLVLLGFQRHWWSQGSFLVYYWLVLITPVRHDFTSVIDTGKECCTVSMTPLRSYIAGVIDTYEVYSDSELIVFWTCQLPNSWCNNRALTHIEQVHAVVFDTPWPCIWLEMLACLSSQGNSAILLFSFVHSNIPFNC
jgi:hypothetical protein